MAKAQQKTAGKKRLNLDIPQPTYDRIKQLEVLIEASSTSEVIRRSLTLYDYLVRSQKEGFQILLRDGDTEKEVIVS